LTFCNKYFLSSFGGENDPILWIDIDKKNFVNLVRKVVYILTDLEDSVKYLHVASKTPLEKVMFFSAVAKPRLNRDFDERILLFLVCTKRIRKRKTKYGKPGEVMFDKVTMNTKLFKEYCIDHLILAILKHIKRLLKVKQVIIQMDQAGGHGGGRKNIASTLNFLNNQAKTIYPSLALSFQFISQPSKSLDFNILDLGIWYSLSCGVPGVKWGEGRVINRIFVNVLER
jgi:hypothetical protein